jgi:hypothetical protein
MGLSYHQTPYKLAGPKCNLHLAIAQTFALRCFLIYFYQSLAITAIFA